MVCNQIQDRFLFNLHFLSASDKSLWLWVMKSNFTKHRQQYLYVQSKASKWLSSSLEMGVLPPGKPFHPENQGLLSRAGAALSCTWCHDNFGLSPAGSCPQAGSGSVGDIWAVSAQGWARTRRAHALLRGLVSLTAHGDYPPVRFN